MASSRTTTGLTNNLTVNLGLRYEYTPWLTAYRNQGAVFDPTRDKPIIVSSETDQIDLGAQALADVGYQLFGDLIQTSSQAGVPLQLTKNDTNQWAPRARVCVSPRRPHGHSRRLRHVLRSRRHERPAELPLPAVQHERNGERHGQRRADPHDRGLFSGRAVWRVRRKRGLESADARRGLRISTSAGTSAFSARSPAA